MIQFFGELFSKHQPRHTSEEKTNRTQSPEENEIVGLPARIIRELAETLHIPEETVKQHLNEQDGSMLIFREGLSMSEVELAMFLKSFKKRVFAQHLDRINQYGLEASDATDAQTRTQFEAQALQVYREVAVHYQHLLQLHQQYYQFSKQGDDQGAAACLLKIEELLGKNADIAVLDSQIAPDRFFELLPEILAALSAYQLETRYAVNTLFRKKLALQIASRYGLEKVVLRGSLIRGDSRAFGNGDNANFSWIQSSDSLERASGSDFDFKFNQGDSSAFEDDYKETMTQLNQEMESLNLFIDSDLGVMSDEIYGDAVPARLADQINPIAYEFVQPEVLVKLSSETDATVDTTSLSSLYRSIFVLFQNKIDIQEMKKLARTLAEKHNLLPENDSFNLDEEGIVKILQDFRGKFSQWLLNNTEYDEEDRQALVEIFTERTPLLSLRRQTDFLGYIDKKSVASSFLRLLDGYDFSPRFKIADEIRAIDEIFDTKIVE